MNKYDLLNLLEAYAPAEVMEQVTKVESMYREVNNLRRQARMMTRDIIENARTNNLRAPRKDY
jgi:hypothetical protein